MAAGGIAAIVPKRALAGVEAAGAAASARPAANTRLALVWVVNRLVEDGLLARSDADRVFAISDRERNGHPLVLVAEMNFRSADAERRLLDIETVSYTHLTLPTNREV